MNASPLASRLHNINNPFAKQIKPSIAITEANTNEAIESDDITIKGNNKPTNSFTLKKTLPDLVTENHVDNPFTAHKPFVFKPLNKKEEERKENIETAKIAENTEDTDIAHIDTTGSIKPEENSSDVDNTVENSSEPAEMTIADTTTDTDTDTAITIDNSDKTLSAKNSSENCAAEEPVPAKKKRIRRTKQQIEADNAALAAANVVEATTDTIDTTDTDADNEIESIEAKATDSDTDAVISVSTDNVEITGNSTVSFNEASKAFDSFGDEDDWVKFYEDVIKTNADIKITTDINTSSLIGSVCQLSNLRDRIWQPMNYYKNELDSISSKEPEGFLERAKRMAVNPNATNDALRKKSATYACMNYKLKSGDIINLYDYIDKVRERYNFLRSVMDNIEFKKSCLMLAASALKMENSLTA